MWIALRPSCCQKLQSSIEFLIFMLDKINVALLVAPLDGGIVPLNSNSAGSGRPVATDHKSAQAKHFMGIGMMNTAQRAAMLLFFSSPPISRPNTPSEYKRPPNPKQ